jgi:hypothetical protein
MSFTQPCQPSQGVFAGMSQPALQAALGRAQQAMIDLGTGVNTTTVTYSMAGEQRSVTYTRANMPELRMLIQDLQRALGISPRRGLRFSF